MNEEEYSVSIINSLIIISSNGSNPYLSRLQNKEKGNACVSYTLFIKLMLLQDSICASYMYLRESRQYLLVHHF